MELSDRVLTWPRVGIPNLAFFFTAALAAGCVSLDQPKKVQACATSHNCSNEPIQPQGPDANEDTVQPAPDLSYGDKPAAKQDLGPDGPIPDASADQADRGPDPKDVAGTDSKDTGISPDVCGDLSPADQADQGPDRKDDTERSDADSGLPPSDCGPELGPDTNRQDVVSDLGPDLGPDLGHDSSPDTSTLLSGLLAYYKCESATGTTLQDSSGNKNNGTLATTTSPGYTFAAGKAGLGNALTLANASQAYVSLPPAMFAKLTDITIAAWVNVTTAQSWARLLDVGVNAKLTKNTSTGTHYMNLVPKNDGTNLAFAISKDGYSNEQKLTSAALPTGTWKHVAVVLSSGQGTLYVDGTSSGSGAISLRPVDLGTIDYAYLGKSQFSADPYFDGQIDELRVYGRALSAAEIKELYQYTGS